MSISTISSSINKGVSNAREYVDNKANVLVRPKSSPGISGFLFDVPETEDVNITSEITDHYTEDNSYINDHEVRKPITITLTGLIGELVYRAPEGIGGSVQELSNRLEVVEAYAGNFTPGAIQTMQRVVDRSESVISSLNQKLDRVQNVVSFFDSEGPEETAQQKAFNNLFSLWKSSILLTVQTPWRYFDNMRITNIGFSQDPESNQISNITVTLKELRFATIKTTDYSGYVNTPRSELQNEEVTDIGKIQGRTESFLFSASEALQ